MSEHARPTLTGPRIRLRPWRPDDAQAVYEACQDPEIQRWTLVPVPYRHEDAESFVTDLAPTTWAEGGALFAVEPTGGGPLIGSLGLNWVRDGIGALGYWTVPGQRGHGYTAEAARLLAAWALDDRGLHRVEAVIEPANTASRRVVEAAGFVAEGTLRQRYLHRGEPRDVVLYSRLATDPR